MNIQISSATRTDVPEIYDLVKGLAAYVGHGDDVTNTVESMQEDLGKLYECILAKSGDELIGIALYFYSYSSWVGKSIHLDDLYVLEEYRGNKVGSMLLNELFSIARSQHCNRVRWQVLNSNTQAKDFYQNIGASIDAEYKNCDFDKMSIAGFKLSL